MHFPLEVKRGQTYNVTSHPECPHFTVKEDILIILLPHLRILFDYLLKQDVRIVFFSENANGFFVENPDTRNALIIPKLLTSFWGSEKYEALKSSGQFRIHFSDQTSYYRNQTSDYETYLKNLKSVIQDKESLSNVVLVDDASMPCNPDEEPYIHVRGFYPGTDRDYSRLNSVYYMLGVFRTYFEDDKYRAMWMKDALTQILPADLGADEAERYFDLDHTFVQRMTDLGLSAVREEVPNATLYERPPLPWVGRG